MTIQSSSPHLRAVSVTRNNVEELNSRQPWEKVLTPNRRRKAVAGDYIIYILNDVTLELPAAGEVWTRSVSRMLVSDSNFYRNFKKLKQTNRGEYDIAILPPK